MCLFCDLAGLGWGRYLKAGECFEGLLLGLYFSPKPRAVMNTLCWNSLLVVLSRSSWNLPGPLVWLEFCILGLEKIDWRGFWKGKIEWAHDFTLCSQMFPPWASSSTGLFDHKQMGSGCQCHLSLRSAKVLMGFWLPLLTTRSFCSLIRLERSHQSFRQPEGCSVLRWGRLGVHS